MLLLVLLLLRPRNWRRLEKGNSIKTEWQTAQNESDRTRERERETVIKKITYERPVLHNYIDVVNPLDKTETSGT